MPAHSTYRLDSTRHSTVAVCQLCPTWRAQRDTRDDALRAVVEHNARAHPDAGAAAARTARARGL